MNGIALGIILVVSFTCWAVIVVVTVKLVEDYRRKKR